MEATYNGHENYTSIFNFNLQTTINGMTATDGHHQGVVVLQLEGCARIHKRPNGEGTNMLVPPDPKRKTTGSRARDCEILLRLWVGILTASKQKPTIGDSYT